MELDSPSDYTRMKIQSRVRSVDNHMNEDVYSDLHVKVEDVIRNSVAVEVDDDGREEIHRENSLKQQNKKNKLLGEITRTYNDGYISFREYRMLSESLEDNDSYDTENCS